MNLDHPRALLPGNVVMNDDCEHYVCSDDDMDSHCQPSLSFPESCLQSIITGFHSWMWKGLSFLLPFLYAAYGFQFYNGLTLYKLSLRPECEEWQVIVLAGIFFLLSAGNTFTISQVVYQKLRGKLSANITKHIQRIHDQRLSFSENDSQVNQNHKKQD